MTLLLLLAVALIGVVTIFEDTATQTPAPVGNVAGIPQRMLEAYNRAVAAMSTLSPDCRGLDWTLLAALAQVESTQAQGHQIAADGLITPPIIGPILDGHGAGGNTTPVYDTDGGRWDGNSTYDAAVGALQFLPSTFAGLAAKVRPEGGANPNNIDDEAMAAALYLCGNGRDLTDPGQLFAAIYQYNASTAYVDEVLKWRQQFQTLGAGGTDVPASERAQRVIDAARSQIGVPYSWGGGDEQGKSTGVCCSEGGQDGRLVVGFDCSGLMLYAFAQVGVHLPRLASDQAGVGTRIPASAGVGALQPGDMVFFAPDGSRSDSAIYHVGLYIGGGQMIAAPKPGDHVKQQAVWSYNYAGGARVL
ncbi:NlpC/P60 family protein [Streptomyces sp. NRRL B-24484]|uniref:C40 family peptidase n=1 Tax=Streptomyces sp. NRRL B-24484 TaxID=1463833 RepID=UPI001F2F73F0|nr:NlpC/P60 family protein [Streptomyces sp. NRRL B-24484]